MSNDRFHLSFHIIHKVWICKQLCGFNWRFEITPLNVSANFLSNYASPCEVCTIGDEFCQFLAVNSTPFLCWTRVYSPVFHEIFFLVQILFYKQTGIARNETRCTLTYPASDGFFRFWARFKINSIDTEIFKIRAFGIRTMIAAFTFCPFRPGLNITYYHGTPSSLSFTVFQIIFQRYIVNAYPINGIRNFGSVHLLNIIKSRLIHVYSITLLVLK